MAMKVLVTGTSGHLGEALARSLAARGDVVAGLDRMPSAFTSHVGDINDAELVREAVCGARAVLHAATLHKPHVSTHPRRAFIEVNVAGTLSLLEAAIEAGVESFVFTSTTSVFGEAMRPTPGAPAVWVDERLRPAPRNIYAATKFAAEQLCGMARREAGLATIILRTSRFFPEMDDDPVQAAAYAPDNLKLNEFLHRRVDIEDVVSAHLLAAERAAGAGTGPFVISATSPFRRGDLTELARDAPAVLSRRVPEWREAYAGLGWRAPPVIERVYVNAAARRALGWRPRHDFRSMLALAESDQPPASALAGSIGAKGYHRDRQAKDSVIAE